MHGLGLFSRDVATGIKLMHQLELFEIKYICTDHYPAYNHIVPKELHIQTKAEMSAIEGLNSRIRHYLTRFRRKTFCYSKAIHMIKATLKILLNQQ